jgi:hypothetical protein
MSQGHPPTPPAPSHSSLPTPSAGAPRPPSRLAARARALLACALLAFTLLACEVKVEDVQKWEKTTESLEKMREFVLTPRNSFDVKLEALTIIVRRNESHVLPELLSNLNNDALREELIAHLIPRLEQMLLTEGNHHLQTTAKDAARYLSLQTSDAEKLQRLRQIMINWVNLGNYQCPDQSCGQVAIPDIIEVLGADALQIVEPELRRLFADFSRWIEGAEKEKQALSPQSVADITAKILKVLLDAQAINSPEAEERAAVIVDEFVRARFPNIPELVSYVFTADGYEPQSDIRKLRPNKSPKLLALAEFVLKTNPESYKHLYTELLKFVILWEYFPKIVANLPPRDGKLPLLQASAVCLNIVQQQSAGVAFTRWQCLMFLGRTRTKLKKEERVNIIELAFESVPDDPAVMHLPADHPFTQTNPNDSLPYYDADEFLVQQVDSFCSMLGEFYNDTGSPLGSKDLGTKFIPMDQVRKHLTSTRTIERIIALRCLLLHGSAEDVPALRALAAEGTEAGPPESVSVDISAWKMGFSTLGELADGVANSIEQAPDASPE